MKYQVIINFIYNFPTVTPLYKVIFDTEENKITVEKFPETEGDFSVFLHNGEFIVGKKAKKYSIKTDGIEFLKNLKYQFNGSAVRATEIKEMD